MMYEKQTANKYYVIYKPFGMLSKFSREEGRQVLGELSAFPKDVYPVGRLDADSEGLLILTNDTKLNQRLLNPVFGHKRSYLVQVEGDIHEVAIEQLRKGVTIKVNKKSHTTLPARVRKLTDHPNVPDRHPPIRFRANIPTSWIELTIQEGKNRQVRKMTAKTGFPTLRLIRKAIENLEIKDMQPGEIREISRDELYRKLDLNRLKG